jgi:hypothetical protein
MQSWHAGLGAGLQIELLAINQPPLIVGDSTSKIFSVNPKQGYESNIVCILLVYF